MSKPKATTIYPQPARYDQREFARMKYEKHLKQMEKYGTRVLPHPPTDESVIAPEDIPFLRDPAIHMEYNKDGHAERGRLEVYEDKSVMVKQGVPYLLDTPPKKNTMKISMECYSTTFEFEFEGSDMLENIMGSDRNQATIRERLLAMLRANLSKGIT